MRADMHGNTLYIREKRILHNSKELESQYFVGPLLFFNTV